MPPTRRGVLAMGKAMPFFICQGNGQPTELSIVQLSKCAKKMREIKIFENAQFGQVRTTLSASNEPLFCLKDLCNVLSLRSADVVRRLNDEVVSTHPILDNLGRKQKTKFVDEDGLYDVILDSKKPEAKSFRKWLTSEVLPSIRKTGGYIAERADDTPEDIMARALKVADATLKRREERIKELEVSNKQLTSIALEYQEHITQITPAANYANEVLLSEDSYTSTQMAKELGLRSAQALHQELKNRGVMFFESGSWMLTSKYSTRGYTKTRTFTHVKGQGQVGTKMSTVCTETGRVFLNKLFNRYQTNTAL